MGQTIAEKILAKHSLDDREIVKPGEYLWAQIDGTYAYGDLLRTLKELGISKVFDPDRVFVVDDHAAPPPNLDVAEAVAETRRMVKEYGISHWYEYGRHGIIHQLLPEKGFCVPGDLIALADSHATTYGFLNVASCPIHIENIYVLAKGKLWFKVPESIKITLNGSLPYLCVGKDVILKIAGLYGTDFGIYKSIEFHGSAVKKMSLDSRWTISNMGVEIGAKFAIFEADDKTRNFLKNRAERDYESIKADEDASYEKQIELDASALEPMVSLPHDPGNSKPVSEVTSRNIKIDQGFIGSCTNGRMEDLEMAAKVLKGNKVHPDVRLIISPASMEIWTEALRSGLFEIFVDAGALVCHPTCGPCYGGHMGILAAGERCISSTNRNFKGRMGSPDSEVYLANAATVAASTVKGVLTDPRKLIGG